MLSPQRLLSRFDFSRRNVDRGLPICKSCSGISLLSADGYVLHENIGALLASSRSCGMCRLVWTQIRSVLDRTEMANYISGRTRSGHLHKPDRKRPSPFLLSSHRTAGKIWLHAFGLHLKEFQWFADPKSLAVELNIPEAYPEVTEECLDLLAKKVNECLQGQGDCSASLNSPSGLCQLRDPLFLPRRVIDVGDQEGKGGSLVCLRESAKAERGDYITLSYRWGVDLLKSSLRTTVGTIENHHEGIEMNVLPKTFQDAIKITRRLGVRYLWIDALCIIQDDHSDWLEQAPRMGKIYQNSYCTIAAHSGNCPAAGILECRSSQHIIKIAPHKTADGISGTLCIGLPRGFKEAIDQSWIKRRAWVLQELKLSRRTVHFSDGNIYWDCPHLNYPRQIGSIAQDSMHLSPAMKIQDANADFVDSWLDVVTDYSKCELTYASDKLAAISGIAAEWQRNLGNEIGKSYHSGLFESSLPQSLLWYSGGGPLRKYKRGAPSWSWATVEGPIQLIKTQNASADAHIVTVKIEPSAGESLSAIGPDGQLLIRASAKPASVGGEPIAFGSGSEYAYSFMRPGGATVKGLSLFDRRTFSLGQASLDAFGDRFNFTPRRVLCLRLCTVKVEFEGDMSEVYMVLLVKSRGILPGQYERVGVGLIDYPGWFDGVNPRDIVIV